MSKKINKNKIRNLEISITREIPLIAANPYINGLIKHTSKITGFKMPVSFLVFDHQTTYFYRPQQAWFNSLPFKLSKAAKNKKRLAIMQKSINQTISSIKFFKLFLKKKVDTINKKLLMDLSQKFEQGIPGLILSYWIPIFNEQGEIFDNQTVKYFSRERLKIEEFFNSAVQSSFKYLEILSVEHRVDRNLLKYASQKDIYNLVIKKSVDTTILKNRQKTPFVFIEDKLIFSWTNINRYLKSKNYRILVQKKEKIIKGLTCFPGKLKGKVKIILSREQFNKFKKGDILVSAMTSPQWMPVIRKASAIVTNEGGLLSHAAIISRELNIPCVIGTKIATRVLKDGDLVEVDANKGLVRKLNK